MADAGLSGPPAPTDHRSYPVVLDLTGRRCLVVGGGATAARKAVDLLTCGAEVTVVAPDLDPALERLAVDRQRRPYRPGEAAQYRLVLTTTGVEAVDRQVFDDAEAAGVWVNSVDDPAHCSFFLPSISRDDPVTVAVSTSGTSPALASWLRHRIEGTVQDAAAGSLALLLAEARQALLDSGRPTAGVDWRSLLDGPLPELVRLGRWPEARRLLAQATQGA
jgi:siroheme synthase-like protein